MVFSITNLKDNKAPLTFFFFFFFFFTINILTLLDLKVVLSISVIIYIMSRFLFDHSHEDISHLNCAGVLLQPAVNLGDHCCLMS